MRLEVSVLQVAQMFSRDDVRGFVLTLTAFDQDQNDNDDDEETQTDGSHRPHDDRHLRIRRWRGTWLMESHC